MDANTQFIDDGCNYMTEDEIRTIGAALMVNDIDTGRYKNVITDVNYGTLPGQLLDIYYPDSKADGDAPYPVIFFVHGGGWIFGNRRSGSIGCILDAIKSGYVVISIEYRLFPQVKFPEFIYDVKTAVRWARANAEGYNLDPRRFGMIGDSAGGYNTLMAGFTAGIPAFEGYKYGWEDYSGSLRALCVLFAPVDMGADNSAYFRETGTKRFMRETKPSRYEMIWAISENQELLSLLSPINYIHKDIPPVLIMHGNDDGMVARQHSIRLHEKIEKICGKDKSTLLLFDGRNHEDPAFLTPESCAIAVEFFDRYLK